MYVELPAVTATPAERLQALKDAKELMTGTPEISTGGIFGGNTTKPRDFFDADEAIRVAEYITTGHDYKDTHPVGKRRPVIKQVANVTVVAPPGIPEEEIEHFLHHVENGDFADFLKDAMNAHTETAEGDGEKADEDTSPEADPDRDSDTPPPAWKL